MDSVINYYFIITIMLLAGLLGGITNFFRTEQDKGKTQAFAKNIFMGVSASLLIPLFLNMISSNLIKETSSDTSKLLVLFGFCLIASLSSKAFIQTVPDVFSTT